MGESIFNKTANKIKNTINPKDKNVRNTNIPRSNQNNKKENRLSGIFGKKENKSGKGFNSGNNRLRAGNQENKVFNKQNTLSNQPQNQQNQINNQNNPEMFNAGYEPMINKVSENMFGESNIKGWNNYYEAEEYINSYYEDIDKPRVDPKNLYESEKSAMINTRQINRENMSQDQQPNNRLMKNKNMLRGIKENEKVAEATKLSRFGAKKAEDFIVGDVKGVKREKKILSGEPENYKVSISKDDYENEYNVLPEENRPKQEKKKLFSKNKLKRNEKNKKRKEVALEEQTIEKNYQYLRKEVDGTSPLYKLDFLDKIRVTRRYLDEKSGKTARKEAERFQKEQRKRIEMQAQVKKKLREQLIPLINRQVRMQRISITLPMGKSGVLDDVLKQDTFSMFNIKKIQPNPNLDIYKVNVPILLEFTLIGDIIQNK